MKFIIFVTCLVASDVVGQDAIEYKNEMDENGYNFHFKTDDIERTEKGTIDRNKESINVEGLYKFSGTDGQEYKITFIADENGYHPKYTVGRAQADLGDIELVPYLGKDVLLSLAGGGLG